MKKYIFVLILVVILFNGFSNLREITELAIVTVMGLDIDDNGKYVATIEIIDADKEDSKKTITSKSCYNCNIRVDQKQSLQQEILYKKL